MVGVKDVKDTHIYLMLMLQVVGITSQNCPSPCFCKGNFEVYCNNTGISDIPVGIPKETTVLDLGGNKIKKIPKRSLDGLLNLTSIGLEQLEFTGHEIEAGALDLPNLTVVDLSNNRYIMVPPNLPKTMSRLYFFYNPIKVLDARSFQNYSSLEYFDMSNCHIQQIKPNTFDALVNVNTINIAFTNLTNAGVPNGVFAKNNKLESLNLRFNHLTGLLKGLPDSLKNLDYVGNAIHEIPSRAFEDLPNLETLAFWNSPLSKIDDNAFAGLDNLTLLDFMSADISSPITKDTFSGLPSLQTLYLDDNHVPSIEVGALHDLKSLTSLWLSGNNLSFLDEEVLDTRLIPNLNTLFIEFNPWYCDCNLRWLREKVGNASYSIQDPHLIVCHGPEKVAGKPWDELKPEDFVCN